MQNTTAARRHAAAAAIALVAGLGSSAGALGQAPAGQRTGVSASVAQASGAGGGLGGDQQQSQPTNQELLDDFIHYVYIAQIDLAKANANALLKRGLSPVEFLGVVEDSPDMLRRFSEAYRQAMAHPELEGLAAKLNGLYEQGRLDRARNPEEIARNIKLLDGSPRGRMLATERLKRAGEYAAPQLLETLLARSNQALEAQVERLLVEMGGDAVMPLAAALPGVDETTQARLALILGQTQHGSALPYLYDVMRSTPSPAVREATVKAITNIQGAPPVQGISVAELYWDLGEKYYRGGGSLVRFPGEEHQLLWSFDPRRGLYPIPIRTEVYNDARAMQLAERAMQIDPQHEGAISLWIAANFSRDIDQPQGYQNPVYPATRHGAMYFAVLAGSGPTQRVLARALDERRTVLARRAIEALSLTLGDVGMWSGQAGGRPLLDALAYPDRRVQYDAALALAGAKPTTPFPGSDRVTPILAGAVRDAAARFAVVLAQDVQRRQALHEQLASSGFTVLQAAGALGDVASAVAEAPGVDLIITDLATDATMRMLEEARANPKLRATPILAMMPFEGWTQIGPRYQNDPLTDIARTGLTPEQIAERVSQLVLRGSGPPVSPEEATDYAVRALGALRDLAISRNTVFSVADAAPPLIGALDDAAPDVRMRIADVLARVGDKRAQVALMDAAIRAEGSDRIALLGMVAESAKAFGNQLEARQVRELAAMTASAASAEATAAAALVGALNLQETDLVPLILREGRSAGAEGENAGQLGASR